MVNELRPVLVVAIFLIVAPLLVVATAWIARARYILALRPEIVGALTLMLGLSGCTVTRVTCSYGDHVNQVYGDMIKTPGVRSCTIAVRKNGLLNESQAKGIKDVLEAGKGEAREAP